MVTAVAELVRGRSSESERPSSQLWAEDEALLTWPDREAVLQIEATDRQLKPGDIGTARGFELDALLLQLMLVTGWRRANISGIQKDSDGGRILFVTEINSISSMFFSFWCTSPRPPTPYCTPPPVHRDLEYTSSPRRCPSEAVVVRSVTSARFYIRPVRRLICVDEVTPPVAPAAVCCHQGALHRWTLVDVAGCFTVRDAIEG